MGATSALSTTKNIRKSHASPTPTTTTATMAPSAFTEFETNNVHNYSFTKPLTITASVLHGPRDLRLVSWRHFACLVTPRPHCDTRSPTLFPGLCILYLLTCSFGTRLCQIYTFKTPGKQIRTLTDRLPSFDLCRSVGLSTSQLPVNFKLLYIPRASVAQMCPILRSSPMVISARVSPCHSATSRRVWSFPSALK